MNTCVDTPTVAIKASTHKSLLYRQSLASIGDLRRAQIDQILDVAETLDHKRGVPDQMYGKIAYIITDEPSSRTVGSQWTAWERLGGDAFFMPDAGKLSSFAKKESLFDAFRVYSKYSDIIVMRSKNRDAVMIAAEAQREERNPANRIPYINAGSGDDQHPTQVLLEALTFRRKLGRLGNLRIVLCGDCKYSRTLRSDIDLFSRYEGNHFDFVSPDNLRIKDDKRAYLESPPMKRLGITYSETRLLSDVVEQADVVIMTRSQSERHAWLRWVWDSILAGSRSEPRYPHATLALAEKMKPGALLAHPLPRNAELPRELDILPQSVYLEEEIEDGVRVRMAAYILIMLPYWQY